MKKRGKKGKSDVKFPTVICKIFKMATASNQSNGEFK